MWKASWLPQSERWKILATSSSVGVNSPHEQVNVCLGIPLPNHMPEHLGLNMDVASFRNKDSVQQPYPI